MPTEDPRPGASVKPRRQWPWYRPVLRNWRRYYLRQFPRKKKLHGSWIHRLLGNRLFDPGLWLPTRDTVAWGVALGVFIGLLPFPGLQIFLSVLACFAFRVNVTAAVVATFISNPFTAMPLWYIQAQVGNLVVGTVDPAELEGYTGFARRWVEYGKPLMFGALVTGIAAALLAYPITLLLWSGVTKAAGKAIAARHAHKLAHAHGDPGGEGPARAEGDDRATDGVKSSDESAKSGAETGGGAAGMAGDPFDSGTGESKKD